ncbi:MAG TPA: iron dicitrate transport regulator FecR [Burkholderiales bacterium]|nr:iron dicitrate transport regulator FecR [Burkholderiales bacterium]
MAKRTGDAEDPRRAFLLKALAAGLLAAGSGVARAQFFGRRPQPMPAGRSVYEASGAVTVSGQPVTPDTRIAAGARIDTGKGAQLVFVVGSDAFLLRGDSRLELAGQGFVVNALRLASGALLSVFGRGERRVITPTSTVGIRGTGLYVESEPERSYVCTCYGAVNIAAPDDPAVAERIVSRHHDAPRYVLKAGARRIQPAPFINHTDVELALIEALVGRTPPFSLFDEDYGGARRY